MIHELRARARALGETLGPRLAELDEESFQRRTLRLCFDHDLARAVRHEATHAQAVGEPVYERAEAYSLDDTLHFDAEALHRHDTSVTVMSSTAKHRSE